MTAEIIVYVVGTIVLVGMLAWGFGFDFLHRYGGSVYEVPSSVECRHPRWLDRIYPGCREARNSQRRAS